ncbi:hypothetical protein [Streptomyces zagrosensis]|uniref:Uncharacterized protein n=1 Tax=Streptomyces zagrosensis TaxID=1042984 RepID=A0A7W9QIB4_9ACTN|nr:hypothetical protein [Streptomyces zagrosensis]MBB5940258.1 hypothetical protein [Streptomyces zagrosensis]
MEELEGTAPVVQCLAVGWVPRQRQCACRHAVSGEILHVFNGGTWDDVRIGEIRLPPGGITAIGFFEPARHPDLLSSPDARRALSALRARSTPAAR